MSTPTIDPQVFFTKEHYENPYATLKILRDHYPAYNIPETDMWILSRYDDVAAAIRNKEDFSSAASAETIGAVVGPTLIEMDGEEHKKRRNILGNVFVGKNLRAMLPMISRITSGAIEKYTKKHAQRIAENATTLGEIDIVDDFATRLPLNVILDVLGLPLEAHDLFHNWYPAMTNGMAGPPFLEAGQKANEEFHEYIEPIIEERRKNPQSDLLSRILTAEVDGHVLSKEEVKSFASLLFVGGAETTDKAIGNFWYWLLSHPEQLAAVQENPDLLDRAFFEMMRVHGPSSEVHRRMKVDYEIHGQVIPKGALVTLSLWGANRDDRVFKDPDTFNIFREDLDERFGAARSGDKAGHLGFGLGAHFCLGYHLAQTETVIGTRELLKVLRNPRFKPGFSPEPIAMRPEPWQLLVEFDVD